MRFAVSSDHAGFPMKQIVVQRLEELGHEVLDLGTDSTAPVDYPDFAALAGRAILDGRVERAVVLCGSGGGAAIAANKLAGIRAAVCHDAYSAHQVVEHDDVNVLCLGARVIGPALAGELLKAFAGARFSGDERHQRRLDKIGALEKETR
ncbi:MAG: ribose 5-phosphate isomerase B [Acidobacteriota bacterium]